MPGKRKLKRWYRPWRWLGRADSAEGLYDMMGDGADATEHAAMEAALDLPKEAEVLPEAKLARTGDPLAAPGGKSHMEAERARVRAAIPGVVVARPHAPKPVRDGAKVKAVTAMSGARLVVDERPAPQVKGALGLDKLSETIAAAATRDEVAREIVAYMAKQFRRVAIFAVRQDQATGWVGAGPGFFPERLGKTTIPIGKPGLFSALSSDPNAFIGPVPETTETTELYAFLGGRIPSAVLIVPVAIRDRVVSILYADNDNEPLVWVDVAVWKRIAEMMALSFEIMILKSKMKG